MKSRISLRVSLISYAVVIIIMCILGVQVLTDDNEHASLLRNEARLQAQHNLSEELLRLYSSKQGLHVGPTIEDATVNTLAFENNELIAALREATRQSKPDNTIPLLTLLISLSTGISTALLGWRKDRRELQVMKVKIAELEAQAKALGTV